MARLAGDLGIHLLGPMLQTPCIGAGVLRLGETDVLGAEPLIPWQQEVVLSDRGVCMVVVHLLYPVTSLGTSKEACTFQTNSV